MYQYPQFSQYPQYPIGFNSNFGNTYAPNSFQAPAPVSQGPHVPHPQNYYAFTRETLLQVLEKLSQLIDSEFPGMPIRLVAHGGACVLLHSGLHTIADRRATHSGFLVESQRFTTRDVDYIHRSFVKEYEQLGVHRPGERLKKCIYDTAVQMGHEFSLGADWMNSDPDAGLPLHEDFSTRQTSDPVYEASITPVNMRRNTVFVSRNNKLTIVCIPAAWAVALKLHRYSLKDSSDICLWLILESRNRSIPWDVESVKQWLESECPDMNYGNFDRQHLIQRRERIERVLAILSTTNNGALEYNIDQVQAFLPNGKTGIQPPGTVLPETRPVSTDRFQMGSNPEIGWHPNPAHLSSHASTRADHKYPISGYDPKIQFSSGPLSMGSGPKHESERHRIAFSHRPESSRHRETLSPPDTDSDSEIETDSDSSEDLGAHGAKGTRHGILRKSVSHPAFKFSGRNVTIREPAPEIMTIEEQTARQMSRMVVDDRPGTPYQSESPAQHQSRPDRRYTTETSGGGTPASHHSSNPRRQHSMPSSQGQIYRPNLDHPDSGMHSRNSHAYLPHPSRHSAQAHTVEPEPMFIPPLPTEGSRDPFQRSWDNFRPQY